jgi:mono/diheme cytochrome c family protein
MNIVFVATLLAVSLLHTASAGAQGNADAGKKLWTGNTLFCRNCHGTEGQGGFGPDLAGRGLSAEQFRHAVRTPWGIMPAYIEKQISDPDMANLAAYFNSLPRVATPGAWTVQVPAGAPVGQQLLIASYGCGQCHGPEFADSRQDAGAAGADFAWFANLVYNHTTASPEERRLSGGNPDLPIRMGNFSRIRVPEVVLQQLWRYISVDLGLRVPIESRIMPGVPAGAGMTYTVTVENVGNAGQGLTAEDLTIALTLPPGSKVVNASGAGYQGVRPDPKGGADMAVWTVARMAPRDKQTYTITLPAPAAGAQPLRGVVRWSKPALGNGRADMVDINPPRTIAGPAFR